MTERVDTTFEDWENDSIEGNDFLYHAAPRSVVGEIFASKAIKPSWDGMVYLASTPTHAARFLALRATASGEDIVVFHIPIERFDKERIEESYDHNPVFFGCRGWMYPADIPLEGDEMLTLYSTQKPTDAAAALGDDHE